MRIKIIYCVKIVMLFYVILYFNYYNFIEKNYIKENIHYNKELFLYKRQKKYNNISRNVIIGMLAKYKWDIVKPFFHTLTKSSYKDEIICFVLDESKSIYNKYYEEYKITPIYFSLTHPYLYNNSTDYPIPKSFINQIPKIPMDFFFYANVRFFFLNIFLQIYSNRFSYILTTDIRDMFFQSNPFNWNYSKGIYLSHETQHCEYNEAKKCSIYNYRWILPFNPTSYILNQTFINAGQIFGSSNEMKEFMKDYVKFMIKNHFNNRTNEWTCDQGMLNIFVYLRNDFSYPVIIFKAGYGYVRILGLDLYMNKNEYEPDDDLMIRNIDGSIPCMIHQSDYGLHFGSKKRREKFKNYISKWFG